MKYLAYTKRQIELEAGKDGKIGNACSEIKKKLCSLEIHDIKRKHDSN